MEMLEKVLILLIGAVVMIGIPFLLGLVALYLVIWTIRLAWNGKTPHFPPWTHGNIISFYKKRKSNKQA